MPYLRAWLDSGEEFIRAASEHILNSATQALSERAKEVEQSCPRWATAVGQTVNMELAKVMLLDNPRIPGLPAALTELWKQVSSLTGVAAELKLPPVTEYGPTREVTAMAMNTLSFGKATVKVSAAIRALVSGNAADQAAVLSKATDLPPALIAMLESGTDSQQLQQKHKVVKHGKAGSGFVKGEAQEKPHLKRKASVMAQPVQSPDAPSAAASSSAPPAKTGRKITKKGPRNVT